MPNTLTHEDYAQLLACIEGIHQCRGLDDFPAQALAALRQLVECETACYAEVDYARKRLVNVFDPPLPLSPPMSSNPPQEWLQFAADHPVLKYFKVSGDGQALKISDFVDAREYHRLEVYRKIFQVTGVEDQIGFGVRVGDQFVLGFCFSRGERSFTERNRTLLNLVRPHVVQAYVRLEELAGHERLQQDLQAALRENGVGVIILDGTRSVVHATPGARDKLATYLPVPEDETRLPEALTRWAFLADDGQNAGPFLAGSEPARLIVRRVRQDGRTLLMLSEENSVATAERLTRFQLTPRELEVLRWIAAGKSNAEIGAILGVTTGTAKIHVERILAKLGVENRTAAVALLRQFGI
ncbi:MAG TPA: LuxR C-terminal-related transcriptional regulator [Verrucomicrobiae bacterium]|nr:LuxR C-terminal-related transcriptional regulator [Verrucomicrobiae bacterium]